KGNALTGRARVPDVEPWLPHTHGRPALYRIGLAADLDDGGTVDVDLGRTGFRSVRFAGDPDGFAVQVNGVDVFFRGGCWTPPDPLALTADAPANRRALERLRDAGANMVRVCGPFVYEADDFYATCDELGIAVWQDFMFANLDYPFDDPGFERSATDEADQVPGRL